MTHVVVVVVFVVRAAANTNRPRFFACRLRAPAFDKPLVSTFIKSNLRSNVQGILMDALKGNETSNYELEFETKTKETVYLLVNATTRRDPDGTIVGVVGVAQDVTETKNKENAIVSVARELRQLVDTANAPIFGIDPKGLVNEWNNKTAEITGFSRSEAWDKPLVSTFIKGNLRDNVQHVLLQALKGHETSNYEVRESLRFCCFSSGPMPREAALFNVERVAANTPSLGRLSPSVPAPSARVRDED